MIQSDTFPERLAQALQANVGLGNSSDFDLNGAVPARDRSLRAAAVLVPLQKTAKGWSVILTKRSSSLKHHPGQIAFPGGKVDAQDSDECAAALREAREEISLMSTDVRVIGTLPNHETITAFNVSPFVGLVAADFVPRPEVGEVEDIFAVPLEHVTRPENFLTEWRLWNGQRRYYYTIPFGPYYIWGATARMLRNLAMVCADV